MAESLDHPESPAILNKRLVRRIVAVITCILVAAFVLILLPPFRQSAFSPLPQHNGYDILVEASTQIIRHDKSVKEMNAHELSGFVAQNHDALDKLRHGLTLPCAVPVQMTDEWVRTQTIELMNLKRAGTALDAQALLLYQQGDPTGAVNACLDLALFGQAISKNGCLINFLVGSACEVMAVRRLTNVLSGLDAVDCKRAAQALLAHESRREPLEMIVKRDLEWSRRTYGSFRRIRWMIQSRSLRPEKEWEFLMPDTKAEYVTRARESRLTILKLASRAFELERGRKPSASQELGPDFLPYMPLDPVSNAPMGLP